MNDEKNMDWCIRRGLDGVITDNIPKLVEMCKTFEEKKKYRWPMKLLFRFIYFNIWIYLFGVIVSGRFGKRIDRHVKVDKNS